MLNDPAYTYDWRYRGPANATPGPPRAPQWSPRAPRGGPLIAAAAVIAIVAAVLGGVAGAALHESTSAAGSRAALAWTIRQPSASVSTGWAERVAAKVMPSVVTLQTHVGSQTLEGSGIILRADGMILTNNHVVALPPVPPGAPPPSSTTTATFNDGRSAPFSIVATDPTTDIAVVGAQGVSGLTPITMGSSANLHVAQPVLAVGSPLGLPGTVTTGIISALDRAVSATDDSNNSTVLDAIQTDASMNPGNSGGALVDVDAALVGMNSATATMRGDNSDSPQIGFTGVGFAIPVDQARRISDQLIAHGKATHASLGVQLTSDASTHGAKVVGVLGGGPAAAARLPVGSLITRADNHVIDTDNALIATLRAKAPGDKITLAYTDPSGANKTAQVTLGSAES